MITNQTQSTLDMLKAIQSGNVQKAFTVATGLVAYDLEAGAKKLYPVLSPLRNELPRVKGQGDTATRWKAITAVNTGKLSAGVAEGRRGGVIATATANYLASYAELGLEDTVSFESTYAAEGFDDVRARAVEGLLASLMLQEEAVILGGNCDTPLGTPSAPVAILLTAQGTLAPATLLVYVVALTPEGLAQASVAGGVQKIISRLNADGTTETYGGGSSNVSAASNAVTTAASNLAVSASVPVVKGAAAYAWFIGTSAATAALASITTINSVVISVPAVGTQMANTIIADNSINALLFNGLITLSNKGNSGYYFAMPTGVNGTGTGLTGNNGAIVEFEVALKSFWDNNRMSPDTIWLSAQEVKNLPAKLITSGGTPIVRLNLDPKTDMVDLTAGITIGWYLNRYSMGSNTRIKLRLHPNMPAGTILFTTSTLPYKLSGVGNVMQIKERAGYNMIEWALKTRQYEYGVYVNEVLQHYAPFTLGVICNVADA